MKALKMAAVSFALMGGMACAGELDGVPELTENSVRLSRFDNHYDDSKAFGTSFRPGYENLIYQAEKRAGKPGNSASRAGHKSAADFAAIQLTQKLRIGGVAGFANGYPQYISMSGMATPPAGFLLQYTGAVGLDMLLLPPTVRSDAAFSVQLKYRY